jgi:hypothetical protein
VEDAQLQQYIDSLIVTKEGASSVYNNAKRAYEQQGGRWHTIAEVVKAVHAPNLGYSGKGMLVAPYTIAERFHLFAKQGRRPDEAFQETPEDMIARANVIMAQANLQQAQGNAGKVAQMRGEAAGLISKAAPLIAEKERLAKIDAENAALLAAKKFQETQAQLPPPSSLPDVKRLLARARYVKEYTGFDASAGGSST